MPELPEVETIMRGLFPQIIGLTIEDVIVRQSQLRWPIPIDLKKQIHRQTITHLSRRGKYLLVHLSNGTIIIHLGMSGSLRLFNDPISHQLHDHLDLMLSTNKILRYNDPRRFGAVLFTQEPVDQHPLLKMLGLEPLESAFSASYLQNKAANRKASIKVLIMNSKIVTGVGNIYATEALFVAKIHPQKPAGRLTFLDCQRLVTAIKETLMSAIAQGGTTLKDYVNSEGKPGYFAQKLLVYGKAGLPCPICKTTLSLMQLGQRSTVFCALCQGHNEKGTL